MRPAGAQLCRAPEFCSTSLETASPPKVEGRLANRHPSLLWMVSKISGPHRMAVWLVMKTLAPNYLAPQSYGRGLDTSSGGDRSVLLFASFGEGGW